MSAAPRTCSISSRNACSAQWMSSMSATAGPATASDSKNLRAAHEISCIGKAAPLRPIAEAIRAATSAIGEQRRELGARFLGRVLEVDVGGLAHHLAQRPEGDAVAVREAAAAHDARARAGARDDLARQPRLADAGVADQRDEARRSGLRHLAQRLVDRLQLLLAADDRRVEPPRVAFASARRNEPVRRNALLLALQLERLDRLDLHRVAHQAIGRVADVDLVRRRRLLEPRRDVDGVAGGELLVRGGVVVGDDLAGVDAGAHRQLDAVVRRELLVDGAQRRLHAGGRAHGAQRVVLVLHRQAEHGHDRVADVLLDLAAVARDLRRHRREVAVLDLVQRLGVEALAERGRVLQVAEDDRDRAPDLARRQRRRRRRLGMQGRAAVAAEAELGRVLLVALGAVDHPGKCKERPGHSRAPGPRRSCTATPGGRFVHLQQRILSRQVDARCRWCSRVIV